MSARCSATDPTEEPGLSTRWSWLRPAGQRIDGELGRTRISVFLCSGARSADHPGLLQWPGRHLHSRLLVVARDSSAACAFEKLP